MSASGMMPPPNTTCRPRPLVQQFEYAPEQRHVRAGQDGQADRVGVLLDRGLHDLLGRLVQAGVDDLHAGVAQRSGHHLGAAVVPVEAGLRNDDPNASTHRQNPPLLIRKSLTNVIPTRPGVSGRATGITVVPILLPLPTVRAW